MLIGLRPDAPSPLNRDRVQNLGLIVFLPCEFPRQADLVLAIVVGHAFLEGELFKGALKPPQRLQGTTSIE